MTYIQTIILGIVEGLTEFLPVSSTGHLIITGHIMNVTNNDFTKSFGIIIQFGAILAVVVFYAKRLIGNFKLLAKVFIAFLPTAILGLIFYKIIKTYLLGNIWVTLGALFIGGILILRFEKGERQNDVGRNAGNAQDEDSEESIRISYKQAFMVGLSQAVAMIPGVSRSGATIIGGRMLGLSKKTIVEFSFMLAIPTMAAASGLDLLKNYQLFSNSDFGMLALGFLASFIVAMIAIKGFLKYIQKNNFIIFGWYRIVISIIFAIVFLRPF